MLRAPLYPTVAVSQAELSENAFKRKVKASLSIIRRVSNEKRRQLSREMNEFEKNEDDMYTRARCKSCYNVAKKLEKTCESDLATDVLGLGIPEDSEHEKLMKQHFRNVLSKTEVEARSNYIVTDHGRTVRALPTACGNRRVLDEDRYAAIVQNREADELAKDVEEELRNGYSDVLRIIRSGIV